MIKTSKDILLKLLVPLPLIYWSACTPLKQEPDWKTEQQKLLSLHELQQKAHLEENAFAFIDQFSVDMISINRGTIKTESKAESLKRVQKYFNQVSFKKWEDVRPPQVFFSNDATMAYMIVDKNVVLTYENEEKQTIEETTHFAWVSILKKQPDGEWKITCNVSTNKPTLEKTY